MSPLPPINYQPVMLTLIISRVRTFNVTDIDHYSSNNFQLQTGHTDVARIYSTIWSVLIDNTEFDRFSFKNCQLSTITWHTDTDQKPFTYQLDSLMLSSSPITIFNYQLVKLTLIVSPETTFNYQLIIMTLIMCPETTFNYQLIIMTLIMCPETTFNYQLIIMTLIMCPETTFNYPLIIMTLIMCPETTFNYPLIIMTLIMSPEKKLSTINCS